MEQATVVVANRMSMLKHLYHKNIHLIIIAMINNGVNMVWQEINDISEQWK